ncbi:UNVERIFIED_ORG: hypothetical protein GGE64_003680 [Rhizobium etli]
MTAGWRSYVAEITRILSRICHVSVANLAVNNGGLSHENNMQFVLA